MAYKLKNVKVSPIKRAKKLSISSGYGTIYDWIIAGNNSYYTRALKRIVIKIG